MLESSSNPSNSKKTEAQGRDIFPGKKKIKNDPNSQGGFGRAQKRETALGEVPGDILIPKGDKKNLKNLAEMIWLLSQSPMKGISISEVERILFPPFFLGQYKIFYEDNIPKAYAIWAFVSDEADKRIFKTDATIETDEWDDGEIIWLIDVVAPFLGPDGKGLNSILLDIGKNEFKGKPFKAFVQNPSTKKTEVIDFRFKENKK